ncbi:hypothetical protein BJ085DRAFT_15656, partial [Dimargaris cristalligena]
MTSTTSHPTTSDKPKKVISQEVGWMFVRQYYTTLNNTPQRLHCFYNKDSTFIHGREGDSVTACFGQEEIHAKITESNFQDCKVLVSNVDALPSLNGSIIIQVLGELSNNNGPSQRFTQTFYLVEQTNGYYVLNDIFRFLKDDIDSEYVEAEVEVPEPEVPVAEAVPEVVAVEATPAPQPTVEAEPEAEPAAPEVPTPAPEEAQPEPAAPAAEEPALVEETPK